LSQTASGVEQAGHEGIWFIEIEDELGMAKRKVLTEASENAMSTS